MLFLAKNFLSRYLQEEIFPDKVAKMLELKNKYSNCSKCHLRSGCNQVVFGEGNPNSQLMLVGEGPGGDEDQQGRPFVGKAGQLLDKILDVVGIVRDEIYISNVIKCRPPKNRKPRSEEMKVCLTILAGELLIIRPKLVVLLGSTALQGLLEPNGSIMRLRGQWLSKVGIQFMPTYHPGALLRDESKKRDVWEDFQQVSVLYNSLET